MELSQIFDQVAARMRTDFKKTQQALEHPGLKGSGFEDIVRDFLREYLPRMLDISTGILVDAAGRSSRQLDLIVSDSAKTPILFRSGETRVIPVECAYAVFEVKSRLNTSELDKIFQNMDSVRHLEKRAFYPPSGDLIYKSNLYGRDWDFWPVNYFVFAFDSIDLSKVVTYLDERHIAENRPEWRRIDSIFVLNKGVIFNSNLMGHWDALPSPGSRLTCQNRQDALLIFYALIAHYLNQSRMPAFRFSDYYDYAFRDPGSGS